MPITKRAPDGTTHTFPAGTSPDAVNYAMTAYNNREHMGGWQGQIAKAVGQVTQNITKAQDFETEVSMQQARAAKSALKVVGASVNDVAGKVRAAPYTAFAGLAGILPVVAGRAIKGAPLGVRFGDNAMQVTDTPFIHSPITAGNVQFYPPGNGPDRVIESYTGAQVRNGDHEAGHTYQYQEIGLPFLGRWLRGGGQIDRNPLEIDADRRALEIARRRRR